MELYRFTSFRQNAIANLLSQRNSLGHWAGELSTSALSTATALVALHLAGRRNHRALIENGSEWLIINQNKDGGWGDTSLSFSNISTTLLCWSTLSLIRGPEISAVRRAAFWIRDYVGTLEPRRIAEAVKARYGKDRTFSVPILMHCAICGTLGKEGWKHVMPLPYEVAAFPREWFGALRLPVVSYALPALIAIGRARFEKSPPLPLFPSFWLRKATWGRVSSLLHQIQPKSGGYLEATPLTSFVTMALAAVGRGDHPAARRGVHFLAQSVRPDGSWPIDTNLATWATTLAIKALHSFAPGQPKRTGSSPFSNDEEIVLRWLLDQQYLASHPFTCSPPGGWAWTDLSGGVPDADDTPGAMLALDVLATRHSREECLRAARRGAIWLLDLQNRDGGIPTFCRGWGALPFDRSSPDLTAHTLRAWLAWRDEFSYDLKERIHRATIAGIAFLKQQQQRDGSWMPLWFGNQHRLRDEANPTYGTAMVCRALEPLTAAGYPDAGPMLRDGLDWLKRNQNEDGGWGGSAGTPSSLEETALALGALAVEPNWEGSLRGFVWLEKTTRNGTHFPPSPIGFYFAKLWYFEKIYPVVWTVEALNRYVAV